MKKMLLVFALGLMMNLAFAQNSNSCVSCNNNVIDTTKFSSAVGSENISTGLASFASGYQNQALGETANAFGINNLAAGKASFACGLNSEAIEKYSFAFGDSAIAWSRNSIALGKHVSVFGPYSFGVGENVKTTITSSMVIGSGYDDYNPLVNDVGKSLMIGFNSYKPTLFVGGAVGNGFTGKVGIGEVTDPQAKLHIRADTLEIASVLVEPGLSTSSAYLYLGNNNYGLKYSPNRLEFLTGGKYIFYNGNVGIGTYQPVARLHVDGDFQVGDSLNPKPIRLYGSINAEGENAVSFGQDNTVTGESAFAVGIANFASGQASFAGGYHSQATGDYSFGFGNISLSNGLHSVAIGSESKATQEYSIAIGRHAYSTNQSAVAIGKYTEANGASSFSIGTFLLNESAFSVVIGRGESFSSKLLNSIDNSLMVGFNSNIPTFFVGESNGSNFTGKVGIGNVTEPKTKLHIRADLNENADLKLEPTGTGKIAKILLGSDSLYLSGSPEDDLTFHTESDKSFRFQNGDIFIEDINRGIIMKSPDGNCWRGTLDNTGSLHFVQVNCDDLQTGQPEQQPEKPTKTNIYPNPAGDRVNVSIDQTLVGSVLEISDLNGKIILTQKLVDSENLIDLSDYQAGMYIFNISDESGKRLESKKVTKQ